MKFKYLYNKNIVIKYLNNIVYKIDLIYNKNLFIMYNEMYKHQIWKYSYKKTIVDQVNYDTKTLDEEFEYYK